MKLSTTKICLTFQWLCLILYLCKQFLRLGQNLPLSYSLLLQSFTVGFLNYLKLCFSCIAPRKKWNCQGKLLHTHPLLFFYLWDNKKILITNNKKLLNSYIWHSGWPNYQITAILFLYIFRSVGEMEGWFEVDSTW